MCANYVPVTHVERLLQYFGLSYPLSGQERDVFPNGKSVMIRLRDPDPYAEGADQEPKLEAFESIFRFIPDNEVQANWARYTYNARCETVDTKPTYRKAWASGHRCIIPVEAIYEPNYEENDRKSVRWKIYLEDKRPMGIAGIYKSWISKDRTIEHSMAMITVNADHHPFMKRFHEPQEEKRMVVILKPEDYMAWLTCPVADAKERFCKTWEGPPVLAGHPSGLSRAPTQRKTATILENSDGAEELTAHEVKTVKPAKTSKPKKALKPPVPPAPENGELF